MLLSDNKTAGSMTTDAEFIALIRAAFLCSHGAAVAFLAMMREARHDCQRRTLPRGTMANLGMDRCLSVEGVP
jgi:hypothetical protein